MTEAEARTLADEINHHPGWMAFVEEQPFVHRDNTAWWVTPDTMVMRDEWRTMDEGQLEHEESRNALAKINTVWRIYHSLPPSQVDPHTTDSLDTLTTTRAARLASNVAALPSVLWFGLVVGAMVTFTFSLVLTMENVQYHAAFTVLLTILIATSLWMILMIYHPFGGEVHVSPDAFRHAIYVINSLPG